jgi:hypothetical protein
VSAGLFFSADAGLHWSVLRFRSRRLLLHANRRVPTDVLCTARHTIMSAQAFAVGKLHWCGSMAGRRSYGPPDVRLAVRRACVVCEWTAEVIESPDADPDCPWCHAPTRRVEVLSGPTDDPHEHAAALGRIGGSKGGRARAASLSAERRRDIAREAARARWNKKTPPKQPKR